MSAPVEPGEPTELYNGNLTFTLYDDDPEEIYSETDSFEVEGEAVEGATVEVTIADTTYSGEWESYYGGLSVNFYDNADYVGGIAYDDGACVITMTGDSVVGEKSVVITQTN